MVLLALFANPTGFAALGQCVAALSKAAGLMIGGEKGANVARAGAMFGTIAGIGPEIEGMFKSAPGTGTPIIEGGKDIDKNFAESMKIDSILGGGAVESAIKDSPGGLGGMFGAAAQGKTDDLMKLPFGTNLQELVSPTSLSEGLKIGGNDFSMFRQ